MRMPQANDISYVGTMEKQGQETALTAVLSIGSAFASAFSSEEKNALADVDGSRG